MFCCELFVLVCYCLFIVVGVVVVVVMIVWGLLLVVVVLLLLLFLMMLMLFSRSGGELRGVEAAAASTAVLEHTKQKYKSNTPYW